jgi:mannose-6-phosphate isomerase-like protein (cupin superfamily)
MNKISLRDAFDRIGEYWSPRVVADVNDVQVKLVRVKGEFVWHRHEAQDELFIVVRGRLRIEFRDGDVVLDAGDMLVVPRGVEHRPVADEEVQLMLVEPRGTVNTGEVREGRTVLEPERL